MEADFGTVNETRAVGDLGTCPNCGEESLHSTFTDETFEHEAEDAKTLTVHAKDVPIEACRHCGKIFVNKDSLRVRHEHVCKTLGLLTPAEIKAIRQRHRLSQAEFAEITGLSEASISRWERGRLLQNRGHNTYLRNLKKDPELVEKLRRDTREEQIEQVSHLQDVIDRRQFRSLGHDDIQRHGKRAKQFVLIHC
jgi:putative zinc finger/helix-turn-helix YgiT family protein